MLKKNSELEKLIKLERSPADEAYTKSIELKKDIPEYAKKAMVNEDKKQPIEDSEKENMEEILNELSADDKDAIVGFEELKKYNITINLLKYIQKYNIAYNLNSGFQGARTKENSHLEILFAYANYKNISVNNNAYYFVRSY